MRDLVRGVLIGWAVVAGLSKALRSRDEPAVARTSGRMKRPLMRCALALAAFGGLGFLAAASGLIPIRASSGHWAITKWFLEFSMKRSIATHAAGTKVPPLRDRVLILRGAAAYDLNCRPCHGSPDLRRPRVARAMLPPPPYLPDVLDRWSSAELFEIVKHGVKFTGMPAWPAQSRDDEVWAVVAFLREMPKLDRDGYRRLAGGASAHPPLQSLTPRPVVETCARCHGLDGAGGGTGAFPRLDGQRRTYLANAMRAFAAGRRHSGVMEPVAAGLTPAQIDEVAAYYSSRRAAVPSRSRGSRRGEEIATRGIPQQKVPPCADCHGPSAARRNDAYPILDGQYVDYLLLQLRLFRNGKRGGSPYAHLMHPVAVPLTEEQMRDVALFYASR